MRGGAVKEIPVAGILSDIRVIDFGRYVAAPYCASLLGFLGAEVVRVERIGGGDDRGIAPVSDDGEIGAVFLQTGCNKRSLSLDLGHQDAEAIRTRLIESADVVVANFPPRLKQRLGFDYDRLKAIKPDVILANVTAFGNSGPLADQGGFDGVGQAMSGSMYMTGTPGSPVKAAAPYVDYASAVLLAFGVMAALRQRDKTGEGQEVSGALLGTALAVFNSHLIEQGVLGIDRVGTGNRVQTSAPSDVFATLDGHVLMHCPGDGIFKRLAKLIGREDWLANPNYSTDQLRGDHRDELCADVAQWCRDRSTQAVLEALASAGVPAGPVLNLREALQHPQVAALGLLGGVGYAGEALNAPSAGLPVELSAAHTKRSDSQDPPSPGEHTDTIMAELGFSSEEIRSLRERRVIG